MSTGEDESVAVQPFGSCWVETHTAGPIKHGTNFGAAERQAEVAGAAGMNGVDREAAGLGGCVGENLCLHSLCQVVGDRMSLFSVGLKSAQDALICMNEKQKGVEEI